MLAAGAFTVPSPFVQFNITQSTGRAMKTTSHRVILGFHMTSRGMHNLGVRHCGAPRQRNLMQISSQFTRVAQYFSI